MSPWEPRPPIDGPDDTPYDDTTSPSGSPSPETSDMSRTPTPDLPARPELDDEELEQLLRGAFDARTRTEVPDDRVPPAIEWPTARSARRTWLTPLAVAASIAVVAAGGGLALAQQHRTQEAPPATQTVTAEPTSASPTATSTPSATATGTTTGTATTGSGTATATGTATGSATTAVTPPATSTAPSSATTTPAQRVTAAGVTLTVPAGYTFRQDVGSGGSAPISPTWCFDTQGTSDCAFSLIAYDPTRNPLDADTEGGYASNPEYCGQSGLTNAPGLASYVEQNWGGRSAEERIWHEVCADGTTHDIAQYTVMTLQAYGLFSDHATTRVRAAMAQVVGDSTLPAATSTTRLYDHGYLRSAQPTAGGTTVTVDRTVVGRPNTGTQVYTYVIPASVYPTDGLQKAVGTLIAVQTNGSVATGIVLPG